MTMRVCVSVDEISRYVQCVLDDESAEGVESHVVNCPHCRDTLVTVVDSGLVPEWLALCRETNITWSGLKSTKFQLDETMICATNDASSPPATVDFPPSPGNGRYRFDRLVGEGGMGVVWEGTDNVMRRRVALKCLKSTGNLKVLAPRLLQEAASLARLSHPNVVAVFEVFNENSRPTLVMEFVDGPTLNQWRSGRIINERQAAILLEQLALAVQHAHEKSVVHRDLKPSNILLSVSKEGTTASHDLGGVIPKLSDFGLARIMDEQHLTQTGEMLGTPAYMAPEQTLGVVSAIGPAADIYGLGAILYDLLTGTPPHMAQDPVSTLILVRERDPVGPRLLRPELSRDIETICLKCLRKSPGDRYSTAGELAADLRAFLEGRVIKARPLGTVATAMRWCRRHKLLSSALSVAAISLLALVVGSFQFARAEHALRQQADSAVILAHTAEQSAKAEAKRADEMRNLIKKNYDVSMNAVSNLVQMSGLGGEVIDMDELRKTALREGTNVYKSFVDSLPESEQWTLADALAVTRYLEFLQRYSKNSESLQWLEKLATTVDRLEMENPNSPDRYVVRQKYSREMAIQAQYASRTEEAAYWWQKAGEVQESVVALDPSNTLKQYQLAQAMMNAALYQSHCNRPSEAVQLASKSVAAYRNILQLGGETDRHRANFVEKLLWQARFERANGNDQAFQSIRAEAIERLDKFPSDSAYRKRLEISKLEIIGQ